MNKTFLLVMALFMAGFARSGDMNNSLCAITSENYAVQPMIPELGVLKRIEQDPVYQEWLARIVEIGSAGGDSVALVKDFHHRSTYGALYLFTSTNVCRIVYVPVHQVGDSGISTHETAVPCSDVASVWAWLNTMEWEKLPLYRNMRTGNETSASPMFLYIRSDARSVSHCVAYDYHDQRYEELLRRLSALVPDNKFWGPFKSLKPTDLDSGP